MSKTDLKNLAWGGFIPVLDVLVRLEGANVASVFGVIWRFCQMDMEKCIAKQSTIADFAGVSNSTAKRALKILADKGYLSCKYREGAPNEYRDTGLAGKSTWSAEKEYDELLEFESNRLPVPDHILQMSRDQLEQAYLRSMGGVGHSDLGVGHSDLHNIEHKREHNRISGDFAPPASGNAANAALSSAETLEGEFRQEDPYSAHAAELGDAFFERTSLPSSERASVAAIGDAFFGDTPLPQKESSPDATRRRLAEIEAERNAPKPEPELKKPAPKIVYPPGATEEERLKILKRHLERVVAGGAEASPAPVDTSDAAPLDELEYVPIDEEDDYVPNTLRKKTVGQLNVYRLIRDERDNLARLYPGVNLDRARDVQRAINARAKWFLQKKMMEIRGPSQAFKKEMVFAANLMARFSPWEAVQCYKWCEGNWMGAFDLGLVWNKIAWFVGTDNYQPLIDPRTRDGFYDLPKSYQEKLIREYEDNMRGMNA